MNVGEWKRGEKGEGGEREGEGGERSLVKVRDGAGQILSGQHSVHWDILPHNPVHENNLS